MRNRRAQAAIKEPSVLTRRLTGQAAMEFLMTYGWAILIMLVVVAVLFYLGIFSSQSSIPKTCVLPAGFSCYDFDIDANGNIYLDIGQATGRTVTITGIGCAASAPNITLNPNIQIASGSHQVVTIGGTNCTGGDGSGFKGKFIIQYTVGNSPGTRSITGSLSAPLQGNSSSWIPPQYGAGQFSYRRQVLITTGASSDLTDFPTYFIMDTQSLISAGKMNNTCKDLRVLDSVMANSLSFEIENNTCNTTTTVVWVKLPTAKANLSNVIYAFYGNSSASDGQNKAGVWSNGFSLVYHLSDMVDSVGSQSLTNNGGVLDAGMRGITNTAYYYGGVTNYSYASASLGLQSIHGPSTVSLWAKPSLLSGTRRMFSDYCIEWGISHSDTEAYGTAYNSPSAGTIATGNWYHLGLSHAHPNPGFVNTTIRVIKNGVFQGQTNWTYSTQNGYTDAPFMIGGDACYAGTYFNGTVDEVRVSKVARSDDWLIAEYAQTYSVGGEQVN